MASIRLTLYDDLGQEIRTTQQDLSTDLGSMTKIEAAVERFRQQMLPEIAKTLLDQQQKDFKKKWTHS